MADIFKLVSMYQPPKASRLVSHMFCNHKKGICNPVGETEWEQLDEEWIAELEESLFYTTEGEELWKKMMDRGFDATKIIDDIALGVGESSIDPESGERKSYRRRESKASQTQARRLIQFLRSAEKTVTKVESELKAVNLQRDGPVIVFSPDWPVEMEELEACLSKSLAKMSWLIEHYKPLAHARRILNSDSGFMHSVQSLRASFQLSFGEIATLLNAGYAISGEPAIDGQEVRARLKSAEKIFGQPNSG